MTKRFFIGYSLITFFLLNSVVLLAQHKASFVQQWKIEDASHALQIIERADTLELIVPDGLTMWYRQRLTGDYEISYRICMVMQGGKYDRLSDLNCFWAANDGVADDKVKPLLKEYTDASHLLVPNQWYEIRIRVEKGITTYSVNDEELFRYTLAGSEGDGHFGLRLLQNHVLFTDFKATIL